MINSAPPHATQCPKSHRIRLQLAISCILGRAAYNRAPKRSNKEENEMAKGKREIVIIASKAKDAIKAAGCQSSGDLVEALSNKVHDLVEAAVKRAKDNGRATVRPYDL